MRRRYVVTYDIGDPKRLRRTFKALRDNGDHLQLSVFECLLTKVERIRLEDRLKGIIDAAEDQVLFVDLGPAEDDRPPGITTLGRPYEPQTMKPVIV